MFQARSSLANLACPATAVNCCFWGARFFVFGANFVGFGDSMGLGFGDRPL
jgi:hypothetical protein